MKFRKIFALVLIILFLIILFFLIFIMVIVPSIEFVNADVVVLGAHRGNSLLFIENTLPAFESAINDSKYMFIEFDVQYTHDKKLIVHHDENLIRLQKKYFWINQLDYNELLNVSDYHIPTYEEVMKIIAGKKPLNIELKSQGNLEDDKSAIDYIIQDCEKKGILESTLISSISGDVLKYVHEIYPSVKTGKVYYVDESTFLHFDSITQGLYDELDRIGADYIMLHGSNLRNYDSLRRLLPENRTLVIWYFSDQMYIIEPKEKSWVFRLRVEFPGFGKVKEAVEKILEIDRNACIWWCE